MISDQTANYIGSLLKPRVEKAIPFQHPDLPYVGLEHVEAHTTKLLGSAPATEMRSTAKRFYAGDVLYSRLRPYLNKVWHADRDGLCSSEFIVLRGNDAVDGNFLRYRLNSSDFVRFANSLNAGDRPRVDFDQISSFILPPFSLAAQRAAVAEIEKQFMRLEAGMAALRRVQASLKRYRAAVLKAACEGRLVPTEAEWKQVPLKELIGRIAQGWSPKCDLTRDALPDEWAIVTTTAVQSMRYIDNQAKPLPSTLEPRPHIEITAGDFLMTRKGPRKRAGVACLVRSTRARLMVCDTVYRFRCHEFRVVPGYLEVALNSPSVTEAIDRQKAGINESGVSLTHGKLGGVFIPLPSIAEQTRIVAEVERRLSVVEELEAVVSANLQRATRLRQSILAAAFSPNRPTQKP